MATTESFYSTVRDELDSIRIAGFYKSERIIKTPQGSKIDTADRSGVINLCANNYLGLSFHPKVLEAARQALSDRGFGMSSVRFICGTQDAHKELEHRLAAFLGTEDTIKFELFPTSLAPF